MSHADTSCPPKFPN